MKTTLLALASILSAAVVCAQSAERGNPVLEDCQLGFFPENFIEISADKAGVLRQLAVREGSIVEHDAVIGMIDNQEAQMQVKVAEQKRLSAWARSNDTVEEQFATAAANSAAADYLDLKEANSGGVDRVVPRTELRAKELEVTKANLQIEKAKKDRTLAGYEHLVAEVEKEAAQMEVSRRVIKAPFAGQVIELFRKQGEWVDPGEPILQYGRFDMLQCDGRVHLDEYDPREVEGCEVTVECVVGRGQVQKATGRITYVEQQIGYEGGYTYRVLAEIPNKVDRGRWALFPGLKAKMTIHLGTAAAADTRRVERTRPGQ